MEDSPDQLPGAWRAVRHPGDARSEIWNKHLRDHQIGSLRVVDVRLHRFVFRRKRILCGTLAPQAARQQERVLQRGIARATPKNLWQVLLRGGEAFKASNYRL